MYDYTKDELFQELIQFNSADELSVMLDAGYWEDFHEEECVYAALEYMCEREEEELEALDYDSNLHYFRTKYERIGSRGGIEKCFDIDELVSGFGIDGLDDLDLEDYSMDGTCKVVNALASASLVAISKHGLKSTEAAALSAAHEMEAAALHGAHLLKRVLSGRVGA